MIKKVEVKTFVERLYCDKCGEEMKFHEMGLVAGLTYPIPCIHQCPNCGHREATNVLYPKVYYKAINDKD